MASNFVITYSDYDKTIQSAKLNISDTQHFNMEFVTDTSGTTPVTLLKFNAIDDTGVINPDFKLSNDIVNDLIELFKDMAKRQYELNVVNSSTTSTSGT